MKLTGLTTSVMKHVFLPRRASSPVRSNPIPKKVNRSFSLNDIGLSDEQKHDLKEAFGMFEKSRKGKIAARDLGPLLRCLGWNPSERDLEEARHELDVSASGRISYLDVEKYVSKRGGICIGIEEEEEENDIMCAFKVLDKCGTGKIPIKEFRRFMTTMGDKMTSDEVEEIIKYASADGFIEYRDLMKTLKELAE